MSKRADRERAAAGTIFRDGKLVDKEEFNERDANAKTLMAFMKKLRIKFVYGDENEKCPSCQTPKPITAMRVDGKVEHLCRKCFFVWEDPPKDTVFQEFA